MRVLKFLPKMLEKRTRLLPFHRKWPRVLLVFTLVFIPLAFLIQGVIHWLPRSFPANWSRDIIHRDCQLVTVVDGNSLHLNCQEHPVNVRLYCIYAPKKDQHPWGEQARIHLETIASKQLELISISTDRDEHIIGEVYTTGEGRQLINLEQVQSGNAAVYKNFCKENLYFTAEQEARQAKRGIWSSEGLQQTPWLFHKH